MPPTAKKIKFIDKSEIKAASCSIDVELQQFQDEIRRIKGIKVEKDDASAKDVICESQAEPADFDGDLKAYLHEQIQKSEWRVMKRLDTIEQKLDRLLEAQHTANQIEDEPTVEEHLVEWVEAEPGLPREGSVNELDSRLFPIADESTFDWFFERLRNEDYRNKLIQSRWQLTRNVSTKTFQISIKDFLRMHFELTVCVKYSVSGYGARGVKKRKFDSATLTKYVYECFNRGFPEVYTFQDVSKAIVQFWGRTPDSLHKSIERSNKHDGTLLLQSFD